MKFFLVLHASFRVPFGDYLSFWRKKKNKVASLHCQPGDNRLAFLAERQNCQQEGAWTARLIPIVLYCCTVVCLVLTVWNMQTEELRLTQQAMVKIVVYSNEEIQLQSLSRMWQEEKWQNPFPRMICKEFFCGIDGYFIGKHAKDIAWLWSCRTGVPNLFCTRVQFCGIQFFYWLEEERATRSHACAVLLAYCSPPVVWPSSQQATDWYWSAAWGLGTPL